MAAQNLTRLSNVSEPQPDVMLTKWRDDLYHGGHRGPEDVLLPMEVSDASLDYDPTNKLSAFARAGIPEVWIIGCQDNWIEVYSGPVDDKCSKVSNANPKETIAPFVFPDVTLKVAKLLLS